MASERQVIALAGVGHLGRYICEELLASPDFSVIVLTRQPTPSPWLTQNSIPTYTTDYTPTSLLPILTSTRATTLISFISLTTPLHLTIHTALLAACTASPTCKRLIPSEWIGDIESYPLKPAFYGTTREPFRWMLRAQKEVAWTCFCAGWLADYFLPGGKTWMKSIPEEFPVDANAWRACVRGSGEEVQSWTCGRDVGRGVVELLRVEGGLWEEVTYVAGEWSTFNKAIEVMEGFYGRSMPRTEKSWEQIQRMLEAHAEEEELSEEAELTQVEEMMVMSYLAVPKEKTVRHKEKFFKSVQFRDLKHLLHDAKEVDFV